MPDWRTLAVIGVLAFVSYAMRTGGFLAATVIREEGTIARFIRLAPGNLLVAFVLAACVDGGLPSLVGCATAFIVMVLTGREWAALGAGFSAIALIARLNF